MNKFSQIIKELNSLGFKKEAQALYKKAQDKYDFDYIDGPVEPLMRPHHGANRPWGQEQESTIPLSQAINIVANKWPDIRDEVNNDMAGAAMEMISEIYKIALPSVEKMYKDSLNSY